MSEVATIGDNNPPDEFTIISGEINDLYDEAKLWIDGDPITTQGQADQITKLLAMIKAAARKAEEHRIYENTPFDEGKKAIQAKYAPLIAKTKVTTGKAVLAMSACQDTLTPWNQKLQAIKDEEARKAREIAEAKEREAQEAIRAANLEEREEAEKLIVEANKAKAKAKAIAKDNVKGMRTVWETTITDPAACLRHYYQTRPNDMVAFVRGLAETDVRAGIRTIPGCEINSKKVAK